ncbi:MAG: DUF934 domain-containing protein [Reinekea sp.]
MQHLIKDGQRVKNDPWLIYEAESTQGLPGNALMPLSIWSESGTELEQSSLPFGVVIRENEEIDTLLPYLNTIKVIAFEFAKFTDGRAFTQARQLRLQHGFKGEIRACGDFMPDQMFYMERCGFDAFAVRKESELEFFDFAFNTVYKYTYC